MQKNWIGKSYGCEIKFKIESSKDIGEIQCYTTRPDTLFGMSFLALSVDHPISKYYEDDPKFVKFKISNGTTLAAGGNYARDVLVNIDDIENVADAVNAGVYTAIVTLKGIVGLEAGHANGATVPAGTIGGRILTLRVSTSSTTAVNPTAITVSGNMPSQSIMKAMTANPGGVAASAQLGLDGGGVRGTDDQMYWDSAVFSSDNTL